MRAGIWAFTIFFCCCSLPGFAQDQASAPQASSPTQVAAAPASDADRRISLDVVVTDKSGKPVSGLQRQDFTLLDDKQPTTILSFQATDEPKKPDDPPVQVIFVVDSVNNGFQGVGLQRQALEKFLRQDGGRLAFPTSLVLLTDTAQRQSPSTLDGNALADTLNSNQTGLRVIGRSQGFYGGADRLQISLGTLEALSSQLANQPGRKLLIWLSRGWPLLSGPAVRLTDKSREWLFQTVVQLSAELRVARITLYSIDPVGAADAGSFQTFYYQSFLKGVRSANDVQNANLGLQVLATQSGGRVLNSNNNLMSSIASCLLDAKVFYTLSFDSARADHPNEYHALQVKIDKSGLTARTRTGYYAQR